MDSIGRKVISSKYDSIKSDVEKKVEEELIEILVKKITTTFPAVITRKELGAYAYENFFKPNHIKPISVNLFYITNELNNLLNEDKYICEEKFIHRESYIPSPAEIGKKEKLDIYFENGDIDYNKLNKILLKFICDYLEEEVPETISKQEISIYLGKKFYSRYGLNSVKMPFEFLKKVKIQLKKNGIVEYKLVGGVFYKLTKNSSNVKKNEDHKLEISQSDKNELINFLVSGILESNVTEISRAILFKIAINSFFKPKNIQICEIDQQMLEEIVKRLNSSGKEKFRLYNKIILQEKILDKSSYTGKQAESKTISAIKSASKSKIELITNSMYVEEFIKSIVIAYPKQFYTVSELKSFFINNFNKDPGDLITRKLLIQTCIELYNEDKKYYFVDGDGNSLQLWKANSPLEWQRYGLGTVYIPTIQINNKKYDIRNFTLYIYNSLIKVNCVNSLKHRQENITIQTNNISGAMVNFNAYYCSTCNKYYTTTDVIERNFPLKNYPFIRLTFEGYSGNCRREESELMLYGYSVRADGPSEVERHNLLAQLMTFDFLPKSKIVAIIRDHINYNGRRANMENAVKKWQDDLDFVQNFSLSKQRTIQASKVNFIYKGRKQ